MVVPQVRGWIYLIVGILALYFAWVDNLRWAVLLLALSMLFSGYHHAFGKHK
ncbi:MAG: hypothetical protein QW165_05050 [Candidatus Woesearchaeota archaeon]